MSLIISTAEKYLNTPYVFGAKLGDTTQFDCSSFVWKVISEVFGFELPRRSIDQSSYGQKIDFGSEEIGDLLFFDTLSKGEVSHVGICVGKDHDGAILMINANSVAGKVVKERVSGKYWKSVYLFSKRLDIKNPKNVPRPQVAANTTPIETNTIHNIAFQDINASYVFWETVKFFVQKGVITSGSSIRFRPHDSITRAEIAKILCLVLSIKPNTSGNNLKDIQTHWCRDYVTALMEKKIFSGYSDQTFRPDQTLTYGEIGIILIKAFGLNKKATPEYQGVPHTSWFAPFQGILKEKNIIPYPSGNFPYDQGISRGNTFEALRRAMKG